MVDPYSWSHYYAGKVFQEGHKSIRPADAVPMKFVVLELSGREADIDQPRQHSRLPLVQDAVLASERAGPPVFRWKGKRNKEVVEVMVYEMPANQ